MSTARIFNAGDGGFWTDTPYNADFVEDLKATLPKLARLWDPDRKCWWVDPEYIDLALAVILRWYDEVITPDQAQLTAESSWDTLYLQPGAPVQVIRAVYRVLAKMNHPDHGGETKAMQEINIAYEQVMEGIR